jgi:hypothetical protein
MESPPLQTNKFIVESFCELSFAYYKETYTNKELLFKEIFPVKQQDFDPSVPLQQNPCKPTGLWLSVETPKQSVWHQTEYAVPRLRRRYKVSLSPNANLLLLDSYSDLRAFTRAYRCSLPEQGPYISWSMVARHWQGILIALVPVSHLCDELNWYATWDCATACIWDETAIGEFSQDSEWDLNKFLHNKKFFSFLLVR